MTITYMLKRRTDWLQKELEVTIDTTFCRSTSITSKSLLWESMQLISEITCYEDVDNSPKRSPFTNHNNSLRPLTALSLGRYYLKEKGLPLLN
jgi:hypothetical protein